MKLTKRQKGAGKVLFHSEVSNAAGIWPRVVRFPFISGLENARGHYNPRNSLSKRA